MVVVVKPHEVDGGFDEEGKLCILRTPDRVGGCASVDPNNTDWREAEMTKAKGIPPPRLVMASNDHEQIQNRSNPRQPGKAGVAAAMSSWAGLGRT